MSEQYIDSLAALEQYLLSRYGTATELILPTETEGSTHFPLRIPREYADLIEWRDGADPLRLLVMPSINEEAITAYERTDPIGDQAHEVVPGLIHRYPDRCLLLLTMHCTVHCRFCFRREVVGTARAVNIPSIVSYIRAHTELREVIFSGGDPATMPPAFIQNLARQLSTVPHIERWRFHTRAPVVNPNAFSEDWISAAEEFKGKKIVVLHINHVRELSPAVKERIATLLEHKFLVLSQTVLLKGVNAAIPPLRELWTALVASGVKPYYLHHLDLAKGTSHFRISIAEGKKLYQKLRHEVSPTCLPEYVVDLPGGYGKVPVFWLREQSAHTYGVENFQGKQIVYTDYAPE